MDERRSIDRLDDDWTQSSRMVSEFENELARMRQSMIWTTREVGNLTHGIEGGLRRAFDGLVFDGAKLSDALIGVGRSIADTVYSIAMKPVQNAVAGAVAGGIANLYPVAENAFTQSRVVPFAKGGVVSQPVHFPMKGATGLMGEAGPEAIMPLRRGADGRLGVAAAGGPAPVNVTINVSTPDVAGFQRSQSQIAAQMSRVLARGDRNA
ncbi:phage tail tape measure protein [Paracoccus sp. (in: a-proteobacteria)]|uniref:phage tail tape measure protein n=1 Tax=Paracoccus sp. TaxID=267 RepID=UPI0026DEF47E|nr:phage tail tape measure protein [Paracoccus sp. (in: a-proteobacteria)]MDO5647988.1 phage tail tape measure protein [Paracoccus sp. (in: a-proteobacteria)]